MKSGDFVLIDYVGRVKDTNEIFDLTLEDVAKKEGIYNPNLPYGPIPVIIDSGLVFRKIEEEIKKMKVGESKKIVLAPAEAFGERKEELIKLVPISAFRQQDLEPTPGRYVFVGGLRGKILSVSGGRVTVDFNHPLAGKTLEYLIKVKNQIEKIDEQIKAVVKIFTGVEFEDIEVNVKDKTGEIKIKKKVVMNREIKKRIAENIFKWIEGIEKIRFVEEYEKK
jgi:FKBP-type peptidyl-prolyl cis-trans isomerase 2